MTFFTPITDGELGRSAAVNSRLAEMELAILARQGVLVTLADWTTLTQDALVISPTVIDGYNTLELKMALRTDRAGAANDSIRITINNDTSNTYVWRYMLVTSTIASAGSSGVTGFQLANAATGATATSGTYAYVSVRFSMASSAVARTGNFESVQQDTTGAVPTACWGSLLYPVAAAIASLQVVPVNGTYFTAGSQYALYGML